MVDVIVTTLTPVAMDPALSAPAKVDAVFSGIAQWKHARQELMVELLKVWLSDDNAMVREKLRRGVAINLTPLLAVIARQGKAEGVFTASSPDQAARVLVSLIQGLNEYGDRPPPSPARPTPSLSKTWSRRSPLM